MEAYVNGVSTRKVDRLVEQLGIAGMWKDRVSALCRALDEQVEAFSERPLEGEFPYLWLDAKQVKVRDRGQVRSKALVIAYAVHESGRREVIGLDIGEIESGPSGSSSCARCAAGASPGSASGGLRRAPGPEGGDRAGPRLPLAALHRPLRRNMHATAAATSAAWSRRRCGRSSTPRATSRPARALREVIERLPGPSPRSPSCWRRPRRTCSPSTASPSRTGRSCAPPTRWSGSTARSAAAPTSSASSPTTPPRSASPAPC